MENITNEISAHLPFAKMKHRYPIIRKKGVVSPNGEMTPFVHGGRLYRMEMVDACKGTGDSGKAYSIIRDVESGKIISEFAHVHYFPAAFVEGNRVIVTARRVIPEAKDYSIIDIFESTDLVNWTERELFRRDGMTLYNTSLVKADDSYVLLMESNVGPHPFTYLFAKSKNLIDWEFLPIEQGYPHKRYGGGPKMHYCNGKFYVFAVTELPCEIYTNYLYRTEDFINWEIGKYNPFLMPSNEDMTVAPNAADITEEMRKNIDERYNCNNSDVDFCEWQGKTYINYLTGDQLGYHYLAEAEYDGSIEELLENFFE